MPAATRARRPGMRSSTLALPASAVAHRSRTITRIGSGVAFYATIAVLSVLFMGPFIWTVISSMKDASEIQNYPPLLFPKVWHFENYANAWTRVPFLNFYVNSLIVTSLAVLGQTVPSTLVAYGCARFRFPIRGLLFLLVMGTLMIP